MTISHATRRSVISVLVLTVAIGACGGGTTAPTSSQPAAPTGSTSPEASPSSTAAASASTGGAATAALPEACVAQIREYLIKIEPIVSGVDWRAATEVPPQIAEQLDSDAFDPDACPDVSAADAHAAWTAIAFDAAPGALDYIDFIYRP